MNTTYCDGIDHKDGQFVVCRATENLCEAEGLCPRHCYYCRAIKITIAQLNNAQSLHDQIAEINLQHRLSRLYYEAAATGTVYQNVGVH